MSEALPKVSVVCAWYNRADYIRDTINSLLAQDYPNFDITVVNDGSPDPRVREILDSFADPRLRVVHQANTGFTVAIRRAIDESDGEYIAIQGAGDVSLPGRLSAQVRAFLPNSALAIVGTFYSDIKAGTAERTPVRPKAPRRGQLSHFQFSQGELMYRRSEYANAGGYREIFRVGQGADLWMRMLRDNQAYVVPEDHYMRMLFPDGVSSDQKKIRIRQSLTVLRLANEIHLRKHGVDLINSMGIEASLFLLPAPLHIRLMLYFESIRGRIKPW
ncbi:glycosyltransferase [Pseudotabrizicola sp. 4114]|uniref:glycosyltransferase family 2 protein n=1 Tax=Pseudotabrizicola sp. 4114 TaxID=2817731 RepID=UPI002862EFF2|nr:glycosyltransferase involved in cell wall biosynthesis [Pseudorhodobacter sp. 4114]